MVYRTGTRHLSHLLREVDIFRSLTEKQLERVAALCEETSFTAGDLLGVQDQAGSHLYVIRQGEVMVTTGTQGTDLVVRTVRANETVPVAVLLEPPILVTTAIAESNGGALAIPRVKMLELFDLEPQIGMKVYRAVCSVVMNRYRYTLNRLSELAYPAVHIEPSSSGTEV